MGNSSSIKSSVVRGGIKEKYVNAPVVPIAETSLLISLSQTITRETAIVDQYLKTHGGPFPSFEADGPASFPKLPENVLKARLEVLRATNELKDLVTGPSEIIRWMAWDFNDQVSLSAVNHYKMANAFPVGSTATFAEISKAVHVDEMNFRRIMRHAMTNRIFKEVSPGVVAHTAASRVLAEDKAMQDWVGMATEDIMPAGVNLIKAYNFHPASQEMTQTGFTLANNTLNIEPLFATLGRDPMRAKRFGGAMNSLSNSEGYEVQYAIDNYEWAEIDERAGTVVDIGGSHGFVCVALAERFKKMKFVVQDLPRTVGSAPKLDGDVGRRVQFMAHDFYTTQPVKGADVYFFRWIFHNQADKYALKIIRRLIPSLKRGAVILINDHCLPEVGQESLWDEKIIRSMDMIMLELLNSQERTEDDFRVLFAKAGEDTGTGVGFKLNRVIRPINCRMSLIEVIWEGEEFGGAGIKAAEAISV